MIDDGAWRVEGSGRHGRREALGVNGTVASTHPVAAAIGTQRAPERRQRHRRGHRRRGGRGRPASDGVWSWRRRLRHRLGPEDARGCRASTAAASPATSATREQYASQGLNEDAAGWRPLGERAGRRRRLRGLWKRFGTRRLGRAVGARRSASRRTASRITEQIAQGIAGRASVLGKLPLVRRASSCQTAARPGRRALGRAEPGEQPPSCGRGRRRDLYRGELAERIVDFLTESGPFEPDDFARQQAEVYEPMRTDYRGVTVLQTAPPSQGFLMLEQFNILEGFDLAATRPGVRRPSAPADRGEEAGL